MNVAHEKTVGDMTPLGLIVAIALLALPHGYGPTVPKGPKTLNPEHILPLEQASLRMPVTGESGTGGSAQHALGRMLTRFHDDFPFELVIGDSLYGSQVSGHYGEKFEEPYRQLLERGGRFYASLGNIDSGLFRDSTTDYAELEAEEP